MRSGLGVALFALGIVVFPKSGLALSGAELLKQCSSSPQSPQRVRCEGYVAGVASAVDTLTTSMRLLYPRSSDYPRVICGTRVASNTSLVSATVSYLRSHTNSQRFGAASEVLLALERAYPCKK